MTQHPVRFEKETITEVDCLLLPLRERQLLVPNVSIAEIIPLTHLLTINQTADWMLGRLEWRGVAIPVICYEILNDLPTPPANSDARFAVVNGVSGNPKLPFFAMLIQGIPRVKDVVEADLKEVDAVGCGPIDHMSVSIDGTESAFIPNLDLLESRVIEAI